MVKLELIFLFIIILLFGCNPEGPGSAGKVLPATTKIIVDPESDRVKALSQVVDSIKVIPLQTSEQYLIGAVSDIKIRNGNFYILDKGSPGKIHAFDSTGYFLYKIDHTGRAPGEYVSIADFHVGKNTIEVYCAPLRKMIIYDRQTGQYIKETPVKGFYTRFQKYKGKYYFYANGSGSSYNLIITNNSFNKLDSFFRFHPGRDDISKGKNFSLTREGLFFTYGLSDTIYSIGSVIEPAFSINFGKFHMNEEAKSGTMKEIFKKVSTGNYAGFPTNFLVSEQWCIFYYFHNFKRKLAIVGRDQPSKILNIDDSTTNDINAIAFPTPFESELPPIVSGNGNEIISVTYPHIILDGIEGNGNKNSLAVKNLTRNVDTGNMSEYDNPIIIKIYLKAL